mmetsp:Transcript_76342/g.221662  ORF Transcript_76342/g.221662 Transcript_76342/m.221662 type:complete len:239 (-) Transcript_76342:435-1151(-)
MNFLRPISRTSRRKSSMPTFFAASSSSRATRSSSMASSSERKSKAWALSWSNSAFTSSGPGSRPSFADTIAFSSSSMASRRSTWEACWRSSSFSNANAPSTFLTSARNSLRLSCCSLASATKGSTTKGHRSFKAAVALRTSWSLLLNLASTLCATGCGGTGCNGRTGCAAGCAAGCGCGCCAVAAPPKMPPRNPRAPAGCAAAACDGLAAGAAVEYTGGLCSKMLTIAVTRSTSDEVR